MVSSPQTWLSPKRASLVAAFLLAGACGSACAITPVETSEIARPSSRPRTVIIGPIETAKPEWQRLVKRFRRDLADHLEDGQRFEEVRWRTPITTPADALIITGRFEEIDDGNELVRYVVGLGFGGPRLVGRFRVADNANRTLVILEQETAYSPEGGTSAHWQPLVMDDVADAFAERTADAILTWASGQR